MLELIYSLKADEDNIIILLENIYANNLPIYFLIIDKGRISSYNTALIWKSYTG